MKSSTMKMLFLIFCYAITNMSAAQYKQDEKSLLEGIKLAEKALISYDKGLLLQAKELFEKINSNQIALYHQTFCEYKLLEMSMRPGNEYLFDKYYEKAIAHAEIISDIKELESEGQTLLAGIYMMKIASNPMSAVTLSSKIHSLLDAAQKSNPNNPRSYVIRGIMKFQTPGIFGGSNEDAVKNFSKAISLLERQTDINPSQPNWGYLESLGWLGKSQEKLENYDAAKFAYQKALKIEPGYVWIKHSLLPKLEEKIKNK